MLRWISKAADCINQNFARIGIDSYNSLHIKKNTDFHVIILIKSVANKNKIVYYYNIFLGKSLYKEYFLCLNECLCITNAIFS